MAIAERELLIENRNVSHQAGLRPTDRKPTPFVPKELVPGLQNGHPQAWERLVETAGPILVGVLCSKGTSPEDAQDAVQEGFFIPQKGV